MSSLDYSQSIYNKGNCDLCYKNNTPDLTKNLKEKMKKTLSRRVARSKPSLPPKSTIIETVRPEEEDDVSWLDKGNNNTELCTLRGGAYSAYEEPDLVDRTVQEELTILLHEGLLNAQDGTLKRRVLLPQDMLASLSQDIICMARSEPYGLRGAVIYLNLEQGEGQPPQTLGRIECNSHVVSTFEVKVTLREDVKRWCTLKDLVVRGLFGCRDTELYLSPAYKLVKTKLYRSSAAAITITHCC